jgi:hypothetical protein
MEDMAQWLSVVFMDNLKMIYLEAGRPSYKLSIRPHHGGRHAMVLPPGKERRYKDVRNPSHTFLSPYKIQAKPRKPKSYSEKKDVLTLISYGIYVSYFVRL